MPNDHGPAQAAPAGSPYRASRPRVRLAASLEGSPGAPVLVLGNSLGTTGRLWEPQLAALARRFRVLRYEHRGHGGSPAPPGPYRIEELAGDVLELLDRHGIDRAAYAGVSLGGMVGMHLAAIAGERVATLALSCTSAWLPPAGLWLDRAARVRQGGMGTISSQVVGRWFTAPFRHREPGTVASFMAMVEGIEPEGYAGCCEAIAAMDLRPLLPSVKAPVLVIAGVEDPATPPWHGAAIASAAGDSRLHVIRGASHLANVSHPGEFTAALMAHLDRWRG